MSEPVVTQIHEGHPQELGNKWGEKRTVTVGREWKVEIGGKEVGRIRYRMITRERRGKGMRYVYARWQSPGWEYATDGSWFEPIPSTKKECLERIVREAKVGA